MRTIETAHLPIKVWSDEIDSGTLDQAKNLASLAPATGWVALMPDCHVGYGMPIGGVLALKNAILPNAVGVDIGCGMRAVQTDCNELSREQIVEILRILKQRIPVGFNHHKKNQKWDGFDAAPDIPVVIHELDSAKKQLGTLGGGNHFLEIQSDQNGKIWLMLHSGSRNFGYKIASAFHQVAKNFCRKSSVEIPVRDLAYLPFDSEEGQEYFTAMRFALSFAEASRASMLDVFKETFLEVVGANFVQEIDIHHNFAEREHHAGQDVIVHRKGATRAFDGLLGIIPGSQGTSSYIVKGKGNPESFMSCSHGAGRRMSRSEANKTLKKSDCDASMEGIVHGEWKGHFDEAPAAYKNIDLVLKQQEDLVTTLYKLKPLGVLKGDAGMLI